MRIVRSMWGAGGVTLAAFGMAAAMGMAPAQAANGFLTVIERNQDGHELNRMRWDFEHAGGCQVVQPSQTQARMEVRNHTGGDVVVYQDAKCSKLWFPKSVDKNSVKRDATKVFENTIKPPVTASIRVR
ncbi:hypothetical protein [Streptomyces sp. NBC_01431]|uniref:hypothetical protein n=1 Tax=Streptomyces sp. NBC_01431 TaxID=2903863 RepID=UPI002E364E02|nr:hypothetical protein [Streptomyces sp. NBC_01431]